MFGMELMEVICERSNLRAALQRVRGNQGSPGVDGMTVDELPAYLKAYWPEIEASLLEGCYQPRPVRRVEIPKRGSAEKRKLGIPLCAGSIYPAGGHASLAARVGPDLFR